MKIRQFFFGCCVLSLLVALGNAMESNSEGMTFIQGDVRCLQFFGRALSFPRSSFAFTEDPGVVSLLRGQLDNPASAAPSLLFVNSDVPELLWALVKEDAVEGGGSGEAGQSRPHFYSAPRSWKGKFIVGHKGNYEFWFRMRGHHPIPRLIKIDNIPFLVQGTQPSGWEKMVLSFEESSSHSLVVSISDEKLERPSKDVCLEWLIVNESDVKEISSKLDRCQKSWLFYPKGNPSLKENYFTTSSSEPYAISSSLGFQEGGRDAFSWIPLLTSFSGAGDPEGDPLEPSVFFQDGFSYPIKFLVPSFSGRWRRMGPSGKLIVYNPFSGLAQAKMDMNLVSFNEDRKVTVQVNGDLLGSLACPGPKDTLPSILREDDDFRGTGEEAGAQVRWNSKPFFLRPGFNEIRLTVMSPSTLLRSKGITPIALNENIGVTVTSSIPRAPWPKSARFDVQNNGREIVLIKEALSGPDPVFWTSIGFEKIAVGDYPLFFLDAYSFGSPSPLEVGFTVEYGTPPVSRLLFKTPFPFEGNKRGEKVINLAEELRDRGIDPGGAHVSRIHFYSNGEKKRSEKHDKKFHIRCAGFFKEKGDIIHKEEMDLRSFVVRSSCPVSAELKGEDGLLMAVQKNTLASVFLPFEKPRALPSAITVPFRAVQNKTAQLTVDLLAECDLPEKRKDLVYFGDDIAQDDWTPYGWSPSSEWMIFRSPVPDGMIPDILVGNLILKRDDKPLFLLPHGASWEDLRPTNFFVKDNSVYVGLNSYDHPKRHNFRFHSKNIFRPFSEDPGESEIQLTFNGLIPPGCWAKGIEISFLGKASVRDEGESMFGIQPPRLVDVGTHSVKDLENSTLSPSLEIDGKPMSFSSLTPLAEKNAAMGNGLMSMPNGEHVIKSIQGAPVVPRYVEIFPSLLQSKSRGQSNRSPFLIQRLSPTKYLARFNPECPTDDGSPLILDQNFHPGWKAYAVSRDGQRSLLPQHFRINGYANAWIVPLPNGGISNNSLTFEMVFEPQRMMQMWIYLSFLAWIFCIACLLFFIFSS